MAKRLSQGISEMARRVGCSWSGVDSTFKKADEHESFKSKGVRKRYRSRAKSQSDISQQSDDSLPPSPQPGTEPSSPYKKLLGFKSGKRMHSVLNALKRIAPHKLRHRSKDYSSHQKNNLQNRLSCSHPNVSTSNLAAVAKDCCDDFAVGMSAQGMDISDAPSYSDPTIHRDGASQDLLPQVEHYRIIDRLNNDDSNEDSGTVKDALNEALIRQRHSTLRQHAFYQLEIHLRFGKDLQARDSCGTSDPYVKFKISGKQLYKSRTVPKTLEPYWDEFFCIPIEDVFQPLHMRVYDYDFAFQDDFMGCAQIDLALLELNRPTDMAVTLTETGKPEDISNLSWGQIYMSLTLIPKTQEEKEQFFSRGFARLGQNTDAGQSGKKQKTQVWDSVVTLVLVEGKNLLPMDENGTSDPYVKFHLGTEKYKTKNALKTLNPQWLEQFNLHMFLDQPKILEMNVYDKDFHGKDDFMGRCTIDLSGLEEEKTHSIWKDLEDGAGSLFLLITITGTMGTETVSDLTSYSIDSVTQRSLINKYGLLQSFSNTSDIGHLIVKVYKAQSLAAADLCGKSDPFCVVELINARLQTHTEYKTLAPEWNKIFTFFNIMLPSQVTDIHSVLEVTVYDEDRDKRCEFLGKVAIPLLRIRNGEKRWYALKDKKLKSRAKGQILLEADVYYNYIRASIRTFNPKDPKYMQQEQRFKRAIFMRNVNRVKMIVMDVVEIAKFLNSCFLWESTIRSITSFIVFLIITYTFEFYMLPVALLIIFSKNYVVYTITGLQFGGHEEEESEEIEEDDDDDEKESKNEEKKTLKEKLQAVQDATAMIQNILGEVASLGERCKNTFNYSVPLLSWLAVLVLLVAAVVLYYMPIRYLIMAWGINKFTKKLRNPHTIPNNELLDFLSRLPDDDEKVMYRDVKPIFSVVAEGEKKKKKKKN